MNGSSIAIDTNVAVRVLNGIPAAIQFLSAFSELCLPVPVIGELRYGALNSGRPAANLQKVENLLSRCRPISCDVGTAELYAKIRSELKQHGTPIPENDIWIAAICMQYSLPVATEDRHFAHIAGLQTARP